jgi:MutS domain V
LFDHISNFQFLNFIKMTYQTRAANFRAEATALRSKYDRYSWVRLIAFFIGVGLVALLFTWHWVVASVCLALFLGGFYRLMKWHRSIQTAAEHAERLAAINEQELKALMHDFSGFPDGARFLHHDHSNALDLDLFGPHSMFQACCRATTAIGQQRLAQFLLEPADLPTIAERQAAITELKPMLDWRQNFQAFGLETADDPKHLDLLRAWLNDTDLVRGNRLLTLASQLAPWYFFACFAIWVTLVPWPIFVLLLIPVFLVLRKTNEQVSRIHLRTGYAEASLAAYARLMQVIENQSFEAGLSANLRSKLQVDNATASAQVGRLSYIIRQLNMRFNFFAIILNIGSLWDLRYVLRMEKWRAANRDKLSTWFDALREMEALCSLAALWHNNPDWVLPSFNDANLLEAKALGHPLIHPAKRRTNDFSMQTRGHIKLVTGSNMAGKSTFLRTVGLNVVLAQAGAPVCASTCSLSPMWVYTSMRTQDDLSESTSSFYAELKRLKVIIEAVKNADNQGLPVFFLLDEILKGTNSVDRHTGSAALIQQLIRLRGGGIIATHDLELGRMEATSNGSVENLCMEVEIKDGQLFFDYKLKPGVSKSFNATLLMRQMGIEV